MDYSDLLVTIHGAIRTLAGVCGINLYRRTADRRVLESVVLPYFAERDEYARVLFVGCAWYTRHYADIFHGREYWTLDFDPARAKYGSSRHVVGSLENVSAHIRPGSLDLIICNGVFGWGLSEQSKIEQAFDGCHTILREGGIFVLGWNDIAPRRPCMPEACISLRRFAPFVFPPVNAARHLTRTANRHTYDFYVKQARSV
jgi:SAM-dependent methyltransferase